MKEVKEPASSAAARTEPGREPETGVDLLLRGRNGEGQPTPEQQQRKRLIQFSLVVADLLLFGLAALLIVKAGGRLGFIEIAVSVLALALGAWLSCLAIWLK